MGQLKDFFIACFPGAILGGGIFLIWAAVLSPAQANQQALHTSIFISCMADASCKQKIDRACADHPEKTQVGGLCRAREACGQNQECQASLQASIDNARAGSCLDQQFLLAYGFCPDSTGNTLTQIGSGSGLQGRGWKTVNGMAYDVSVGGDGSVWHVGGNGSLYRKMPNETRWTKIHGGSVSDDRHAMQVEAQNKDRAFVRTKDNKMWIVVKGKPWEHVAGGASYIASNSKNDLYHLGLDGKTPYRYEYGRNLRSFWHKFNGAITQISVDPKGNLWGVGTDNGIYQRKSQKPNDAWHSYPGRTAQLSISSSGHVWHIGADSRTPYHLRQGTKIWDEVNRAPEKLLDIAAGPAGGLWAVGQSRKIYTIQADKPTSILGLQSLRR